MKITIYELEKLMKNMMIRYARGFEVKQEKVTDYAESYQQVIGFFDIDHVKEVFKFWNGASFPTAQELKTKLWAMRNENKNTALQIGGQWHCSNNEQSCKSWPIDEKQARISQERLGKVVCYLCEQKVKAKERPGDIEDLWLRQMYPKSFTEGGFLEL